MSSPMPEPSRNDGATVVITHRLRPQRQPEYERWLDEIAPLARSFPGFLDWHIVRPVSGLTDTYTVIIRFASPAHLRAWLESPQRAGLIEKARPLFAGGDDLSISSGLDFWFTPASARIRVPVRWKQYLVTWSAIYPLALLVPLVVAPLMRIAGLDGSRAAQTLGVTGVVVWLMVYVVMPRYTRLLQRWLFA